MTRKLMTKTTMCTDCADGDSSSGAHGVHPHKDCHHCHPSISSTSMWALNPKIGRSLRTRRFRCTTRQPRLTQPITIPSGAFFEVGGGYRVCRRVTVGVSVSFFDHNGNGGLAGLIPDPLFFDRPATVNVDLGELEHKETGVHVFATYWMPISEKMDVTVSIGPSFIHVTQDVVSSITVPEPTQNIVYTLENESGTAVGINVGVDGNYMLTRNYGVGVFLRYAGGSEDLPHAPDLKVGGFQIGLGARIRF